MACLTPVIARPRLPGTVVVPDVGKEQDVSASPPSVSLAMYLSKRLPGALLQKTAIIAIENRERIIFR
jgi:hypothetical protein